MRQFIILCSLAVLVCQTLGLLSHQTGLICEYDGKNCTIEPKVFNLIIFTEGENWGDIIR